MAYKSKPGTEDDESCEGNWSYVYRKRKKKGARTWRRDIPDELHDKLVENLGKANRERRRRFKNNED